MSFLETAEKARAFLERNGRVSLRALQREFNLDDDVLDELIEELVEIQRVAVRDGRALAWASGVPPAPAGTPEHERAPRDYTPKHLADKILQSKSALEGERKQVTVLFADVKGSLELAEQVDPEEWHRILDRFFQILADWVHRFEGTINQYTGDGIMALFGAPIAHENHAQRACHAALHLRDALREFAGELRRAGGLDLSTRIGLNSGEVVVGKIGDDLRMDYTAQGATVHLAQRMEQLAEAGRVYLAPETAALVEGFLEVEELGEFHVKGGSEPIRVYELLGIGSARTRLDVARMRGFTRFVGRDDEMTTLEAALHRALEGHGQAVGVVGEAGMGKSRLCSEFVERCRAKGTRILEARCPAYGKAIPFLPILEFLRDSFAITERDSDQIAREKIAGRLLLLDRAFEESLPLIFDFLGVPDPDRPSPEIDPDVRQRRLFAFVRRLIQAQSEREPAVIFFDDIHWIDAASDGFLAQLVEAIATARTLLLVNFRPEYGADWFQRSYYQRLPVSPLGPADVATMVAHLLGDDASVAPVSALIMERTRGNPFFAEEVVQSLVESGALEGEPGAYRLTRATEDLEVPATVQALLAARIDRLPEQDKQVLHTAAVIGQQFSEPLLSSVVDLPGAELASALGRLQSGEFILEQAVYPVAEYTFKHPLTEQVARESQLQERRRRLHAAVARAFEKAGSEKLDEQAALIGHHWEQAGEALVAARWYRRAAGLVGLSDLARAAELWGRVRELASRDASDAEAGRLALEACFQLLNVGWRTGLEGKEGRVLLDAALGLAERCDEREVAVKAAVAFYVLRLHRGDVRGCVEAGREALALAEATGDPELVAAASYALGEGSAARGHLADGLFYLDQALGFFDRHPSPVMAEMGFYAPVHARMLRGSEVLVSLGRLEEGFEDLKRVLDLAAREASPEQLSFVVNVLSWQARWHSESAVVVVHAERALAAVEKLGNLYLIGGSLVSLGMARLAAGEAEEAITHLEEGLPMIRDARFCLFAEALYVSALARSRLAAGDAARACELAAEAVAIAERRRTLFLEADAQLALAQALRAEKGQAARSAIDRALARARTLIGETGGRSLLPLVHEEEAALAALDGDDSARERHLREAHHLFTEMGATGHAERVARELSS